jgi:hypothetical protein
MTTASKTFTVTVTAPPVGGITHGSPFTLAGSGFGTRSNYGAYAPNPSNNGTLVWSLLDFDGSTIEGSSGWNFNTGGTTHWIHEAGSPRTARSPKWARRWNPDGANSNIQYLRCDVAHPADSDCLFMSYWQRVGSTASGKTIRIWGTNINGSEGFWMNAAGGSQYVTPPGMYDAVPVATPDQWIRVDILIEGRTAGTARQRIWYLGFSANSHVYTATSSAAYIGGNINPSFGAGCDVGPSSTMYWGFDTAYVDLSRARVELANSATWSSVTYSEIQPPTAWSNTSITIRANCGAFTSGQTAHVHIFDASGNRTYWGPVTVN